MKIGITGHTKGIGKAVYIKYLPSIVGFSRHNGFDISVIENRQKLIDSIQDCDVFINNAYTLNNAQVDLLYELYDSWKDQEKHIINIGSNSSTGIKNKPHKYATDKYALEKASEQLSHIDSVCKISLIKFGYVNTLRVMETYNPSEYVTIEKAVEVIDFVIKNKIIRNIEVVK